MSLTRLTVLADNESARADVGSEHGLSILIEHGGGTLLFDAGSPLLVDNARRLGADLSRIDAIALSHGHYDHVGGLDAVLACASRSPAILAHPEAGRQRYSVRPDSPARSIGACWSGNVAARLRPAAGPIGLLPGITWLGQIPRVTDFEDPGGPFFLDPAGTVPDLLPDDTALLIETGRGLVLVTGCSHSGIVNILRHAAEVTGASRFAAVIGGMHLGQASEERIRRTLAAFDEMRVERLGPMHCTGQAATAVMKSAAAGRFLFYAAGTTLEL
jgi:7,8-dihydropterin-6-yl-methyl-4-(beta-D-ribofuranosyl)aminobenzene 5'-phosphate synthase